MADARVNGNGHKHLLSLETVEPERETIGINGVAYELAVMEDFGIADRLRISRLAQQIVKLQPSLLVELTDDEVETAVAALREATGKAIRGSTPELVAGLSDQDCLQVCEVFFTPLASRMAQQPEAEPQPGTVEESLSTSEKPSPVSVGSTALTPG